ncbi:MAG: preprotein translocase subunit YajC [Chloroflexi bacterium]|nr:preprotein translocase subunit YajC [Chloroflexota bacterium]
MQEFALLAFIMALALGAYWAMVIFPKQRTFEKRQRYIRNLSVGSEVITYGGIIGKIVSIDADEGIVHVEIADGIIVRLVTAALVQAYDPETLKQDMRLTTNEERPPEQ